MLPLFCLISFLFFSLFASLLTRPRLKAPSFKGKVNEAQRSRRPWSALLNKKWHMQSTNLYTAGFLFSSQTVRDLTVFGACVPFANCGMIFCYYVAKRWRLHVDHSVGSLGLCLVGDFTGESANAVPHTEKLRARVTHIWGNRRGQPNRSAMERPRPGRSAFLITDPPAPGKYACTSSATNSTHLRVHPCSRP